MRFSESSGQFYYDGIEYDEIPADAVLVDESEIAAVAAVVAELADERWSYSPTTGGFYSSRLTYAAMPADLISISAEHRHALMSGLAEGKRIISDQNGVPQLADYDPPEQSVLLARFQAAIEAHVDAVAGQRGYKDSISCASYAASTVPAWADEAGAFILWRDAVWQQVLSILAKVQEGKAEIPVLEDLIADLPTIAWPA